MAHLKTALTLFMAPAFLAGSLLAADVTGKWSGTATAVAPNGEVNEGPAMVTLKQAGTVITGTAGPSADQQADIKDGRIEGDQLQFKVVVDDTVANVTLHLDGDQLKGQAILETPEGKVTANLSLKRAP